MANNVVSYNKRTFDEIKGDLYALIDEQYSEIFSDFSDSNVGEMLIDINAGVANNLSVNTDRVFQETQLEYAQQTPSILGIGKNMGFNIPNKRPSVTVVDFSVNVPAKGDSPDEDYYPVLQPGGQIVGGGKIFETQEVIDWSSSVSNLGDSNRAILPNLDSNGIIQNYTITKREVVINGSTNIFKKVITTNDIKPFYEIILPDPNVIEIDSIILIQGTNFSGNPTDADFSNSDYKYHEVDYLAQQRIFIEDVNSGQNSLNNNERDIKAGKWIDITKKFIKEYTKNGFCKITFGSGDNETDIFKTGMISAGVTNAEFLNNYLNNTALGEKLKKDHTLFIRYRVGGGSDSNVGTNVLTSLGNFQLTVAGPRQDYNTQVNRSFKTTNPIPAIGGNDGLSVNQIRYLIKYNFSAQNRNVVTNDYLLQIYKMPGKFGSPFRGNSFKENNKIIISILGKDSSGNLTNISNSLLKNNITEYLTEFRMPNDYVEVRDGRIFNLGFDIDLFVENGNDSQIANNVITTVKNYFKTNDSKMNEDIFLTQLEKAVNDVNGVINVLEIKVYNKVGGEYSVNMVEQALVSENTGEIQQINKTIYSTEDSQFEIKFFEKDIRVFLRKKV